ncbi:MAG: FAD/NAD(P)-binding protein [Geminicoccaceae bacterium]
MPRPERGRRIGVIGAGFSGVMTAIHLLWRCDRHDRVYLVEKSGRIGPGLAYGTQHAGHLVNVRAENMGAFADEPEHFLRWLERLPPQERAQAGELTVAGLFVRRSFYADYVQSLLRDALMKQGGAQNLFLVADAATALKATGDGLRLVTAGGRTFPLDAAVLALGNFAPERASLPGYFRNPWDPAATEGLDRPDPILLVGGGLTMVDVVMTLLANEFTGPLVAISRRGLLPQSHAPSSPWSGLRLLTDDRRSLTALVRAVRREVARAAAQGVGWRSVVDALRPDLRQLWVQLDGADKARFLRHVRAYWDVHRHRLAPPVAAAFEAVRQSGQLRVLAGRLQTIEREKDGLAVTWRPKGEAEPLRFVAQRVIECTGPGTDYAELDDPLVRQLVSDGLVRPDPLRLGLDSTPAGTLIDALGGSSRPLFGVGPVTRGTFWEITSVPDIRIQAEQVAEHVLRTLAPTRAA